MLALVTQVHRSRSTGHIFGLSMSARARKEGIQQREVSVLRQVGHVEEKEAGREEQMTESQAVEAHRKKWREAYNMNCLRIQEENREKMKEYNRQYNAENKEKRRQYNQQFYVENKEKILKHNK